MVSSEYSLETYLKGYVEANTLTQCCFCFCLKRKKTLGASQIVLLILTFQSVCSFRLIFDLGLKL